MIDEPFEIERGSGNVYRDLNEDNPDLRQLKALLAAEIIKWLDRESMTVRKAATLSGVPAADFSRIRNADLGRFTADRLLRVINKLGSTVEIKVKVKHGRRPEPVHA